MENDNSNGTPVLETERLVLRKLALSDAEDVFEYAKNPEVSKYLTWDAHTSIDDTLTYLNFVLGGYANGKTGNWAIVDKEENKVIGAISFVQFDKQNSYGEIGYTLSYDYWNKGIMTEALKRVIRFSFEDMKINRVQALHFVENPASGRVMQKANMSYEGLLKQRLYAKEKFWDSKQYAIVKDDWLLIDETKK